MIIVDKVRPSAVSICVLKDSPRLVSVGQDALRFPSPFYVSIAEHLISQFAFQTAAPFNLPSVSIEAATLPAYWETFFYDDFEDLPRVRKNGKPVLPGAV